MKRTLIALMAIASLAATAKTVVRRGSPVPRKPYAQEQEDVLYWFAVTNAPKLYATLNELREWRAEVLAAEKREKEDRERELRETEVCLPRRDIEDGHWNSSYERNVEMLFRWKLNAACNMIREMYNNPPPPPPGW